MQESNAMSPEAARTFCHGNSRARIRSEYAAVMRRNSPSGQRAKPRLGERRIKRTWTIRNSNRNKTNKMRSACFAREPGALSALERAGDMAMERFQCGGLEGGAEGG